jgi:hypothetical protein
MNLSRGDTVVFNGEERAGAGRARIVSFSCELPVVLFRLCLCARER